MTECPKCHNVGCSYSCQKERAEAAEELLKDVINCAKDGCFGPLFIECDDDCECIICTIRKFQNRTEMANIVLAMYMDKHQTELFVVAKSDRDPIHEINKFLDKQGLPPAYKYGRGSTLTKAIQDFNNNHKTQMGRLSEDESAWWGAAGSPIAKGMVTFLGDFEQIRRMDTIPAPVKMPNGQTGYICQGNCGEFFSFVEPNTKDGFICRSCRNDGQNR